MNATTAKSRTDVPYTRPPSADRPGPRTSTENEPADKDFYHPEFEVNSGDRRDPSYVPGYN